VKRLVIVFGAIMTGRHALGTFVLVGSSRVSFNKIAVKSNDKHFS